MQNLYNNYFAKDKSLRHYTQHLLLALLGFFLVSLFLGYLSVPMLFIFLVFSFVIDLDNLICFLFSRSKYLDLYEEVMASLKSKNLKKVAEIATINHKVMNNLVLHNIIFYVLVWIAFVISILFQIDILTVISGAFLVHMTFDILDDVKQLGHINNWLWPINKLRGK